MINRYNHHVEQAKELILQNFEQFVFEERAVFTRMPMLFPFEDKSTVCFPFAVYLNKDGLHVFHFLKGKDLFSSIPDISFYLIK